jgi:RimJ/RimL family protein N-acetyltransferase
MKQLNAFCGLETERLLLRHWQEEDAKRLYELAKDPQVGPAAGWNPHKSVEESREIIQTVFDKPTIYSVVLIETGDVIGCCGFFYDESLCQDESEALLGYWIGTEYWGKGYTTEAARECIRYAFEELRLKRMWCGNFVENARSARVQEKLGFKYHHTQTDNHFSDEEKTTVINILENESIVDFMTPPNHVRVKL